MATNFMMSREFNEVVCKMVDVDPNTVMRIIIDVQVECAVMVYIEQFGTKKLLDIKLPETEMKVVLNGKVT